MFSPDDPDRYRELIDGLYNSDWFMVAADFDAYAAAQREVDAVWRDSPDWYAKAIRNVARMSAGSLPTARSANMRKKSGTCPPDMIA